LLCRLSQTANLPSTIDNSMHPARIAELLQPFFAGGAAVSGESTRPDNCHCEAAKAGEEPAVLSQAQLQSISTYIDILIRWNARINLTAIRDPEHIVPRHFGESLFAARHLFSCSPSASAVSPVVKAVDPPRVADVGSGAGFPGLPLKLWASHISLTLIESNHKKATFLREVTRALTLTNVNIQTVRAESLHAIFNVVTLRAVERFETILPTAASLVSPGGRLALLIGSEQVSQAGTLLPSLHWRSPVPIPLSQSRIVAIGDRPTI
jgi:16S rRNA (guanine527-N7)-methyltransferase